MILALPVALWPRGAGSSPAPAELLSPPSGAATVLQLDPNGQAHPQSSLVDFRSLLDAPAGKHGFLTTHPDGHFYFEDGVRARFWGINVAATSVFQPHHVIDEVVSAFARAGINLVRIHDIDDVGGIIDYSRGDSRHFVPARLHALDYWIAKCRQTGIYIYLDLLDYRSFKRADGVVDAARLGRAAKPYSVFDPRLIALQQEYAEKLLARHINAYTGLSYAADPAVCMLELYDENGLFIKRSSLAKMPTFYRSELVRRWNGWLWKRYGSSAALLRAWTNSRGEHALHHGEYVERSTVHFPSLALNGDWDRPYADLENSPARESDAALFAYTVQANYCATMKAFLRKIGVRIPITAVGSPDVIPDLKALSDTLDFTGNNFYWDHPTFRAPDSWKGPSFYSGRSPLSSVDEYSFAPTTAFFKVRGKPLVLREWNYCWPNPYRDAGMVEAAVYGCLQDVDAMILFTYDTGPKLNVLSYFDVSHDPDRWPAVGPLAAVFLKRLVAPAARVVDIAYSNADTFRYYGYLSSAYGLAWTSRVENVFFRDTFPATGADLVIASGHNASTVYPAGHTIIRTNDRYVGLTGNLTSVTSAQRSGYNLPVDSAGAGTYQFTGDLMANGSIQTFEPGLRFRTAAVTAAGYAPIGIGKDGVHCLGFYDPRRQNYVFQDLDEVNTLRAGLSALHRWYGVDNTPGSVHRDRFASDTGELVRDSATGVLQVMTRNFQVIAGMLRHEVANGAAGLRLRSQTDEGTVMALSLDGAPLANSHRVLVTMLTGASNTGQRAQWSDSHQDRLILTWPGDSPVLARGEPVDRPTEVWLGDQLLASVYLHGGGWQLVEEGARCTFYCDTPGVKVQLANFSKPRILEPVDPGADGALTEMVSSPPDGGFYTPAPDALVGLERGKATSGG